MPGPTPWQLLEARVRTDGAAPLVTMYDDETGERVELSALTFANWVAKTANLLVDDLDLGPGDTVSVELPAHWQSWVIGMALSAIGAHSVTAGVAASKAPTTRVLDEAHANSASSVDLVLSLRPMGAGRVTSGPGLDYASEVRLHGDHFGGGPSSGAELVERLRAPAERLAATGEAPRVLLTDATYSLESLLVPLMAGGSVVLVRHEDPATRERRIAAERVTTVDP